MEAEVIRQRLDDIIKSLFKTMIPKYINGHAVYGGYGVNIVSPAYINLDYGFGFEPNSGNTEITHYWSYGEGIPISGRLDTEENFKLFENRVKDDFKRRLVDMCEAINKDDSENHPTNGDLIRRMDNKELVSEFGGWTGFGCNRCNRDLNTCDPSHDCPDGIYEWLCSVAEEVG